MEGEAEKAAPPSRPRAAPGGGGCEGGGGGARPLSSESWDPSAPLKPLAVRLLGSALSTPPLRRSTRRSTLASRLRSTLADTTIGSTKPRSGDGVPSSWSIVISRGRPPSLLLLLVMLTAPKPLLLLLLRLLCTLLLDARLVRLRCPLPDPSAACMGEHRTTHQALFKQATSCHACCSVHPA